MKLIKTLLILIIFALSLIIISGQTSVEILPSAGVITKQDINSEFFISFRFSGPMNINFTPIVTISPNVSSTIAGCRQLWFEQTSYYSCNVSDSNQNITGINVSVVAKDLENQTVEGSKSNLFNITMNNAPCSNAGLLMAHIESGNSNISTAFPGEEIKLDFKFNKSVSPEVTIMNKPVDLCPLDTQGLQWRGTYKTSSSDQTGKVSFVININGTNFTETTDGSSVFFENPNGSNGITLIFPNNNSIVQNPVIFQWVSPAPTNNLFISGNLIESTNSSNATIFLGPGNYSWFVNSSNGLNFTSEIRLFTLGDENTTNQTNQTNQTTGIFWGDIKIANSSQYINFNFSCIPNQCGCFIPLVSCRQEIFNSSDFWMGNFSNLTEEEKANCTFKGNISVQVSNTNSTFLQYTWDSNKSVNFSSIMVKRNCKGTYGSLILEGFDQMLYSGMTKTAFIDIIANLSSVCIKDSNIVNITEISGSCTASDETLLQCNGLSNKGYTCLIENGRYKITGLNHSGVIEQAQEEVVVTSSHSHSDGCVTDWTCDNWSPCINDLQTRTCVKQRGSCSSSEEKPLEIKSCSASSFQTNSNSGQIYEPQNLISPRQVADPSTGILQSPVLWVTIFILVIAGILAVIFYPKR